MLLRRVHHAGLRIRPHLRLHRTEDADNARACSKVLLRPQRVGGLAEALELSGSLTQDQLAEWPARSSVIGVRLPRTHRPSDAVRRALR